MRILYFTDSHFRLSPPVNRKETPEDFKNKIIGKVISIIKLAKKHKVDAIFCGGDFFDQSTPSYTLFTRLVVVLSKNKIPFYIVPGNHDIFNGNLNTLYRTALKALEKSGHVKILTNGIEFEDTYVAAIPYHCEKVDFKIKRKKPINILIAHHMIVDEPVMFDAYLPSDIDTDADLVLGAHFHKPYDITIGKTRFINPGSLVRLSSLEYNYDRYPSVLLIDTSKTVDIEKIELKEFGVGDEVFNRKIKQRSNDNFNKFMEYINNFKSEESLNLETAILKLAKKFKVRDEVVSEAKKRIV